MPTDTVQWIAFWFAVSILGILVWYGLSEVWDRLTVKALLGHFGRTSIYDNFTRPPTLQSEPTEERDEEEHPFFRAEDQALADAGWRFADPHEFERRLNEAQRRMDEASAQLQRTSQQMAALTPPTGPPNIVMNSATFFRRASDTRRRPEEDRPRIVNHPDNCAHVWQDIPTFGRSFRICGLCGTTVDSGFTTKPPVATCARHDWGKPELTLNPQREVIRQFTCRVCSKTKTERVKQMTNSEARQQKVRSIFLED